LSASLLQDALEKERLAARKFGHVRHDVYKNVIQPYDPTSLSYAPEHERLRKDVDVFVTLDHKNTQSKKQVRFFSSTDLYIR
jgi:hypothetical protein